MRIALVEGGSASKYPFYLGVGEALVDAGIDPAIFVGTSGGALTAAAGAQYGLHARTEVFRKGGRFLGQRDVYKGHKRFRALWRLAREGGLYSNTPLRRLLEERLSAEEIVRGGRTLRVGAVDLLSGETVTARPGDKHFLDVLLASTNVPGVIPPEYKAYGGRRELVDWGVREVNPIRFALEERPDAVIVVTSSTGRLRRRSRLDGPYGLRGLGRLQRAVSILIDEVQENDIARFEEINAIVRSVRRLSGYFIDAARDGRVKRYHYYPALVIRPTRSLGSGTNDDPVKLKWRYEEGRRVAERALASWRGRDFLEQIT